MRLINDGYLDEHSAEELAKKLGLGARHLSCLFKTHVGATPSEAAGTRRVQLAKRLISDTALPLGQIAFEAGFGSVRRFNDAFRKSTSDHPQASDGGMVKADVSVPFRKSYVGNLALIWSFG
jgi:transcriptional regulator GlxA family with amidase domain